jgi:hypothetical protein
MRILAGVVVFSMRDAWSNAIGVGERHARITRMAIPTLFSGRVSKRRRVIPWLLTSLLALGAWLLWPSLEIPGTEIAEGSTVDGAADAVNLAQGWTPETQAHAWFTSFGSRLLPYDWFLFLEQPDSATLFLDASHVRGLGFLPSAATRANPDGLPVGIVRTSDREGASWAGLGCAACHTGEIRYRGQRIRIAGGAGLLDLAQFEQRLLLSLQQTRSDPGKFARFAARVLPRGAATNNLRAELELQTVRLQHRLAMNKTAVAYGPGRMDAFGQIFNAAGVDILGIAANRHAPDAPVSIPVLWDTPRLTMVQWNGSSPNDSIAPLVQNVTTALGVYGGLNLANSDTWGYESNADIAALGKIQQWNGRLKSPRWPEYLLGKLDRGRSQRGRALYEEHCEACHRLVDRDDMSAKLDVVLVPVSDVGTDPVMAENFATRDGATGRLQGRSALVFGGAKFGPRARMVDIVVHLAVGAILRHPLTAVRATMAGHQSVHPALSITDIRVYKARPLDGIWTSAPYLHNGSVPTLQDLLSTPDRRPPVFHVGSGEFDPDRVGLAQTHAAAETTYRFDTSLHGNGNGGHPYGTALDPEQRQDLIEFLKSL